jgi:hypothetical protein
LPNAVGIRSAVVDLAIIEKLVQFDEPRIKSMAL